MATQTADKLKRPSNISKLTRQWLFIVLAFPFPTNPSVIKSSQGTLFVIGATSTAIVVAADSLVTKDGVPVRTKDKLMPLGNAGVCFIGRYSVIFASGSRKPETVDLQETIRDWIRANPTVALPEAHQSMNAQLLSLMKAFRHRHPEWRPQPNDPFSYFMCVGYYMGLQYDYRAVYMATRDDITGESSHHPMQIGRLMLEGWHNVCDEISTGNSTKFSRLKRDAVVIKYRAAAAANNYSSISTKDLLRLSRICLEATESAEGRAFDPDAKAVGPPNRYGVIDERRGFEWARHQDY